MARLDSNNALSGARGRVGNLVAYEVNGKQVVRSRPSRPRKVKASALQQEHINSFAAQHAFAKELKQQVIDPVWGLAQMPAGMNPYNLFIKTNRNAFGKSTHVQFPELVTLSVGELLPAENLTMSVVDSKLKLSWVNNANGAYAFGSDKLHVVLLVGRQSVVYVDCSATRADELALIDVGTWAAAAVEGYVYWSTDKFLVYSPSVYVKELR